MEEYTINLVRQPVPLTTEESSLFRSKKFENKYRWISKLKDRLNDVLRQRRLQYGGDEVLNVSSAREAGERYTDGSHNSNREVGSRARACVYAHVCSRTFVCG